MVRRSLVLAIAALSVALTPRAVSAQSQLVPLVTSDSALALPTTFGTQSRVVRNEAGDVAVLDTLGTAVHLKTNGAPAWARVVQAGDEIPGLAGSRISAILSVQINSVGLVAMTVELNLASGELQSAVLTYNGASVVNVVDGTDTAPDSGSKFGRGLALAALSDNGSVAVTSPLVPEPPTSNVPTTIFIVPSGGAPVRIAGPGDPAPGTAMTFANLHLALFSFNANGELLINASLAGGGPVGMGIFLGTTTNLRKVVASGDPNPGGSGAFTAVGNGRLNNLGRVLFTGTGGGSSGQFVAEPNSTITQIFNNTTAAPVPGGGTVFFSYSVAFNDAGTAVFQADVISNPTTNQAYLRLPPGGPAQLIAYVNQPAPGTGTTFARLAFSQLNATGAVVFNATRADETPIGFYFQTGTNQPIALALHGGPSGVPGGGTADLSRSVLASFFSDGRALLQMSVAGGTVDAAYLLRSSGGATSMLLTTSEELPAGGRTFLSRRGVAVWGSGSFVGFIGMRAGGGSAAFVHHLPTQVTTRVAGDGDVVPGTSDRFRITSSKAFVNGAGQMALSGLFNGAAGIRPGIVLGSVAAGLQKIVAAGDQDALGSILVESPPIALAASGLNGSGQVPFVADGPTRGIWIGTAGAQAVKVAMVTDPIPGGNISVIGSPYSINDAGQVLFPANASLFLGTAGGPIQIVVADQSPAPGGGMFYNVGSGVLNNAGQVAFSSGVFDGTGFDEGGLFITSASGPPVAIAFNLATAPGGGTFASIPYVLDFNDQADVVFSANLAGTSADSGYFIRRGPAGALQVLVRQGDPAPGTPAAFLTLGLFSTGEKNAQLNAGGGVTFRGHYFDGSGTINGYWHIRPDGVVEPVAAGGLPAPGGGSSIRVSETSSWAATGYPIWARLSGAPFVEGVFLFVPFSPTAVPTGSNVQVAPADTVSGQSPVTATFTTVTGAGVITLSTSSTGPALPAGFALGAPPRFYDVNTNATFTGPITVCINFSGTVFPPGSVIRLLHYSGGAWQDVTTTAPTGTQICGSVTTLSPFAVVRQLNAFGPEMIQNGGFDAGMAPWGTFATPDSSYINVGVVGGVLEYFRVPPPPGTSNQALIQQQTGVALPAFTPLVLTFNVGNSSSVRKRMSVIVHDSDFLDLHVCTFWMPAGQPLSPFTMRTHTTQAWANATVSFYAATAGANGGAYRLENVSLRANADVSAEQVDCVDPNAPAPTADPPSAEMIVNGDFSAPTIPPIGPWGTAFNITWQLAGGVFEFKRDPPQPGMVAGVLKQATGQIVPANTILTATFQLGNSSPVRKRVTVILHDDAFGDLSACTFWLEPGQPLSTYTYRTFTTQEWANAALSVYPATTGVEQWIALDNVSLQRTPASVIFGTECIGPSSASQAPATNGLRRSPL
jgi:hypothetical protein